MDNLFPTFAKSIENLIEDEEGNIPGNKLLMLGTMIIVLGSMVSAEVFAKHRSHSSHKSHSSHRSHSSGSHGNHYSHSSHESHQSHTSHGNSSHSNSATHGSSSHSNAVSSAPSASKIPGIASPVTSSKEAFTLPEVNQNLKVPNSTPTSGVMPAFGVPAATPGVKMETSEIKEPSITEEVK